MQMAILDLFSKRQKRLRGDVPDILVYNDIPHTLRVRIVHIIKDALGEGTYHTKHKVSKMYELLQKSLCREYGQFILIGNDYSMSCEDQVLNFLLCKKETDKVVDVIELAFKMIDQIIRDDHDYSHLVRPRINPDEAISELNDRFKEEAIGYAFEGGKIIRIDSTYAHAEITKPTISLLSTRKFKGANEEYVKAHEHYRNGRNKECLADCLKAFESTMKVICNEKKWPFKQTDTSKKLIQICFQNGIVPSFTQNQFTSLQNLLESGIPTIRNKLGGHGQGQSLQMVDDEMTRYALNLTGTNIIFLIEQSGVK